jgi:hypothetical protein
MPTVVNNVVSAGGQPLVGYRVTISLVGQWSANGSSEVIPAAVWSGVTDSFGLWSATLPSQSSYEGSTYYMVNEPNGVSHTFTVADSPSTQRLRDRLMSPIILAIAEGVSLDNLIDVSTAGAANGMVPIYSNGLWAPGFVSSGSSAQVVVSGIAAGALSGHRVITELSDGTFDYASNSISAHIRAPLWVTTGAVIAEALVSAVAYGPVVEPTWSWTPGPLYLGVNGVITQTQPTAPGALFLAQIGFAVTPTSAFIDRSPSIALA